MIKPKILYGVFLLMSVLPLITRAHVQLDKPEHGEHFYPESNMLIEWSEVQDHGAKDWDLYYSLNGGMDWIELALNLDEELREYTWAIPKVESNQAFIKIVQDNKTGPVYEDTGGPFYISYSEPDPEIITAINLRDLADSKEITLTNYPNPFVDGTVIEFYLTEQSQVSISILNAVGKTVFSYSEQMRPAGEHQIVWQVDELSQGIYFCRLKTGTEELFRKMIIRR